MQEGFNGTTERMSLAKQLFLSHTWQRDEQGRDTHARAGLLNAQLQRLGWTVWFDETDMHNNIDDAMASGIDKCETVVMLITRKYARKVNASARKATSSNDNCLKEFSYALFREKHVLPVVFEESMKDPTTWSPGVMPMRLAGTLYVDGTGAPVEAAQKIHDELLKVGKRPRLEHKRCMRARSRSTPRVKDIVPLWPSPSVDPPPPASTQTQPTGVTRSPTLNSAASPAKAGERPFMIKM